MIKKLYRFLLTYLILLILEHRFRKLGYSRLNAVRLAGRRLDWMIAQGEGR